MESRTSTVTGVRWAGALVAAALLGAALLVACGGSSGTDAPASGATIRVAPDPHGTTTVDVKVGDTVVVELDANPTTGFSWKLTAGDTFEITDSKYVPDPDSQGMAGAGGTQVITLKVTRDGTSDLIGTYRQQWNSPSPGAQPDLTLTLVGTG
jgi:inhibitor of cysteine peptidase